MLGASRARNTAGRELLIGSGFSDADRGAPPPVGSVLVYRYRGLTAKGLPRFATLVWADAAEMAGECAAFRGFLRGLNRLHLR